MSFLDILTQAELYGTLSISSAPATYTISVPHLSPRQLKLLSTLLADIGYSKSDALDKMAQLEDQKRDLKDKIDQPGPWREKHTRLCVEQEALLNLACLLPAACDLQPVA
jgi:hypothetical protein